MRILDSSCTTPNEVRDYYVYTLFIQLYKLDVMEGKAIDPDTLFQSIEPIMLKLLGEMFNLDDHFEGYLLAPVEKEEGGQTPQTAQIAVHSMLDLDEDQQKHLAMEVIQAVGVYCPTTIFKTRQIMEVFEPVRLNKLDDYLKLKRSAKAA